MMGKGVRPYSSSMGTSLLRPWGHGHLSQQRPGLAVETNEQQLEHLQSEASAESTVGGGSRPKAPVNRDGREL